MNYFSAILSRENPVVKMMKQDKIKSGKIAKTALERKEYRKVMKLRFQIFPSRTVRPDWFFSATPGHEGGHEGPESHQEEDGVWLRYLAGRRPGESLSLSPTYCDPLPQTHLPSSAWIAKEALIHTAQGKGAYTPKVPGTLTTATYTFCMVSH